MGGCAGRCSREAAQNVWSNAVMEENQQTPLCVVWAVTIECLLATLVVSKSSSNCPRRDDEASGGTDGVNAGKAA